MPERAAFERQGRAQLEAIARERELKKIGELWVSFSCAKINQMHREWMEC